MFRSEVLKKTGWFPQKAAVTQTTSEHDAKTKSMTTLHEQTHAHNHTCTPPVYWVPRKNKVYLGK